MRFIYFGSLLFFSRLGSQKLKKRVWVFLNSIALKGYRTFLKLRENNAGWRHENDFQIKKKRKLTKHDLQTRELKWARLQIFASKEDFKTFTYFKVYLKAIIVFYLSFVLEQTQVLPLNTGYLMCRTGRGSRLKKDRSRNYRNGWLHHQQYTVNQSKIELKVETA